MQLFNNSRQSIENGRTLWLAATRHVTNNEAVRAVSQVVATRPTDDVSGINHAQLAVDWLRRLSAFLVSGYVHEVGQVGVVVGVFQLPD